MQRSKFSALGATLAVLLHACSPNSTLVSRTSNDEARPSAPSSSARVHEPPSDVPSEPPTYAYGNELSTSERPESEKPDFEPPSEDPPLPEPLTDEPFRKPLPSVVLPASSAAMRYANLSPTQCRKELSKRKLPFARQGGNTKGVATALRVTDTLRGVRFIVPGKRSPFGILDCRLALTLDDFAQLLLEHDVVSVRVDNFYRRAARLPGSRKRSQHAHGLAIDLTEFTLKDGRKLDVEEHWGSELGGTTCGPEATLNATPGSEAVILRNLVCAVARSGLFHHILTPSYDRAHRDHLHLDIKRDAKTSMLR